MPESFQKRLDAAQTLDDLLFGVSSPQNRILWERCALVGSFDKALYDAELAAGLNAPSFEEFVKSPDVKQVTSDGDQYQLGPVALKTFQPNWARRSTDTTNLSVRLAAYFAAKGPEFALQALEHQVGAGSGLAPAKFEELYDAAEREFDLSRCSRLLTTLASREHILSDELRSVRNLRLRSFQAFNLFVEDYYLSASYTHRKEIEDQLTGFLDDDKHWIFHLHAPGGFGKTITLRWLISRYAIQPPHRIPCARLDLDKLNPGTAGECPAALVVPLAEQLDLQLSGNPFSTLIRETRQVAAALTRAGVSDRSSPDAQAIETLLLDGEMHADRFVRILKETRLDRPILIVVDTLEELVLARRDALLEFLKWLADARPKVPQIRVILSGRFDLQTAVPGFDEAYRSSTLTHRLGHFSKTEGVSYLRDQRKLPHSDELLQAIWRRASGHPFRMSLFAELALSRESLTVEAIRNFPRADIAYLIERVVERLPADLQWLLRYAVVPRRLTRAFLKNVLIEPLRAAITQQSAVDAPQSHWPTGTEAYGPRVWSTDAAATLDPDQLFDRLKDYAVTRGWVFMVGEGDNEAARFHPSALNPMRTLLREHSVFITLHLDSVRYFEELAKAHPADWADHTAEAIFHTFQLYGPLTKIYWRTKLNAPESTADLAARRRIATEVLGPDYAIGKVRSYPPESRPYISTAMLVEAHTHAARAAVALGQETDNKKYWRFARDHLAMIPVATDSDRSRSRRRPAATSIDIPDTKPPAGPLDALFRARGHLARGALAKAVAVLEPAISIAGDDDRLALLVQLGDAYSTWMHPGAIAPFEAALELRESARGLSTRMIRIRLANAYRGIGAFSRAISVLRAAVHDAIAVRNESAIIDTAIRLGEMHRMTGCLAAAERVFQMCLKRPGLTLNDRALVAREFANGALAAWQPVHALSLLEDSDVPTSDGFAELAAGRGIILGQLLSSRLAVENLQTAQKLYTAAGSPDGARMCHLKEILHFLRDVGNVQTARAMLDSARSFRSGAHSIHRIYNESVDLECSWRAGDFEAVARVWNEMINRDWVRQSPMLLGQVALLGVTFGKDDDRKRALVDLLVCLKRIDTPRARLAMLTELSLAPQNMPIDGPSKRALFDLLPNPPGTIDFVPMALASAEVFRVFGEADRAEQLLISVVDHCQQQRQGVALREALAARDRVRPDWAETLPDITVIEEECRSYPVFLGAAYLEQAMRSYRSPRDDVSAIFLLKALTCLNTVPEPVTKWHNLAREMESWSTYSEEELDEDDEHTTLERAAKRQSDILNSRTGQGRSPSGSGDREVNVRSPDSSESASPTAPVAPTLTPVCTLKINRGPREDDVIVGVTTPDGATAQTVLPDIAFMKDPSGFAYSLVTQFADDPDAALWLGETFLKNLPQQIAQNERCDLRLIVERGPLAAVPWEIARWPGVTGVLAQLAPLRAVYRASNHPVPRAVPAIDDTSELRALIIGPKEATSPHTASGESNRGAFVAAQAYASSHFKYHWLEVPTSEELTAGLKSDLPHLVHFIGKFQQATTGQVYLDCSGGRDTNSDETLSASLLMNHFTVLPPSRPRPVIVIDVPLPRTATESFHQLFLRNLFAAELLDYGVSGKVLAIGLVDPARDTDHGTMLLSALEEQQSLGEIVRKLRSASKESFPFNPLPFTAIVFTDDPNSPAIERGGPQ